MPISPASKLGPYEIVSLLGAGGMGEVYRARDPRLGRDVAIKVLPADRMTDKDRRQSFIQEAQAASALNHPNIVTVHEVDSVDGIDFLVMEYVAGKTLSNAIPRQGMRLDQVLRTGLQIADALASAHAAGIVHRDLKPANVAVSAEGTVKVLDFGLAKLITPERTSTQSETEPGDGAPSTRVRPGTAAGTIGYMSPEQAAGGEVDARSDVFSLGALLYEMATGRPAFGGTSTAEVLAALMREQPRPPSEVVPELPRDLDRLIRRCLKKDPERRCQCMRDVKVELQEIRDEAESERAAPKRPRPHLRRLGAGLVAAVVLAAATWLWRRDRDVPTGAPGLAPPVTSMHGEERSPALSPDGQQVAFEWSGEKLDNPDIYLKIVGSSGIRRLTTDPGVDVAPSWSPDGKQIAFVRVGPHGAGRVHLVSPLGGSDRKLSDFPHAGGSPSWSPDGRWLAVARARSGQGTGPLPYLPGSDGLHLLPVNGGEARAIELPQGVADNYDPKLAPDGRHLAYLSCVGFVCHVAVVDLGPDYEPNGAPRLLTQRPVSPSGGLTWTRDGQSLLFVEQGIHRLWRVGTTGNRSPEIVELAGLGVCCAATAASSDRLVFVKELYNGDIYRFEVGRPSAPVLTSSSEDGDPQFSPNGRRVAFESERSGEHEIWLAEADGQNPTPLTHGTGVAQRSPRWSPDGRRIGFDSQADDGGSDIWTIDADGASPRRLTRGPGDKHMLSWSRDGRSIYFASRPDDASQRAPSDVWRVPEAGGMAERITQGGGGLAYESIDGRTLFFMKRYLEYSPLFALPLAGGPERQIAECVSTFAVGPAGLYSLECSDGQQTSLLVRDPGTGRGRLLGQLDRSDLNGLTVSPDAKTFLYTRVVGEGSDLMMIENFR